MWIYTRQILSLKNKAHIILPLFKRRENHRIGISEVFSRNILNWAIFTNAKFGEDHPDTLNEIFDIRVVRQKLPILLLSEIYNF